MRRLQIAEQIAASGEFGDVVGAKRSRVRGSQCCIDVLAAECARQVIAGSALQQCTSRASVGFIGVNRHK